ncbi:hypothetical protein NL676_025275 [Syzygium grande]|nr:hypothetical protein NL676_025275 [Syzygium grande]
MPATITSDKGHKRYCTGLYPVDRRMLLTIRFRRRPRSPAVRTLPFAQEEKEIKTSFVTFPEAPRGEGSVLGRRSAAHNCPTGDPVRAVTPTLA